MESSFIKRKWDSFKRPGKGLLIAGIAAAVLVLAWIIVNYAFPERMHKYPISLARLKNTFSFVFLGGRPEFYYLDVEKNGKDYRLKKGDTFDISYRDEFVVKEIATDVFSGRGVTVRVDGLAGEDHFRVMLRGIDLVDKVVMTHSKSARDAAVDTASIVVTYKGEVIASLPLKVVIMPQDWLRYAKDSENRQAQIEYLRRAIDMNKNDVGVRKMLAAIYEQGGVVEKAIAQYNDILALKPDDVNALAGLLKCYIRTKDYDKAISAGTKLLRINPRDASAFANIGYVYGNKGAWDKAIANYKESLKLNPDDTLVRFRLGEAYEKANNLRDAVEQYKLILTKAREAENVKIALAGAYLRAGNYDESIRLYKEVVVKQPRNASAYANLGLAHGGKGQWKEEMENYKKAISLNPKDPVAHYNLASAFEKRNHDQDASREYQTVLKINPGDLEATTKLADIDFKNKRYGDAIRAYEKILKSSPRKGSIHANLGFAYGELKKYKLSSEYYEKAIKYGIKDSQVHYNLAYTYDKLGKKKDAIREYEYVASSRPNMDVLDILAEYYTDQKQYENAIKIYKKMIAINPKRATAYSGLGYVYGLKNDIDKEIEYYRISLRYDAENDDVYLSLGKAYEKKGMYQDALKAYTHAYELNPDSSVAAKKIPALKIKMLQQKHRES
ncbi:MAG: tetratricopeptide repeat protein [Syntrophales bacterium]